VDTEGTAGGRSEINRKLTSLHARVSRGRRYVETVRFPDNYSFAGKIKDWSHEAEQIKPLFDAQIDSHNSLQRKLECLQRRLKEREPEFVTQALKVNLCA
jgi:hypothetical protein